MGNALFSGCWTGVLYCQSATSVRPTFRKPNCRNTQHCEKTAHDAHVCRKGSFQQFWIYIPGTSILMVQLWQLRSRYSFFNVTTFSTAVNKKWNMKIIFALISDRSGLQYDILSCFNFILIYLFISVRFHPRPLTQFNICVLVRILHRPIINIHLKNETSHCFHELIAILSDKYSSNYIQ